MAGDLHGAGEEAAIEQVQDRVLDAPDVLIDGQPAIDLRAVRRLGVNPGIGEACKVPRRIYERVHGVGLTPGLNAAAFRTVCNPLPSWVSIKRITRLIERDV